MTTDVRVRWAQVGWREAPSGPRGVFEGRSRSGSSARPISRPSAGGGRRRHVRTRTPVRASSPDCAPMARPSVARCAHSQRTGCLPETRPTKVRLDDSSHRLRPGVTLDSGLGTAIACLMDGGAALLPPWARTTDKRPQLGCGARRHPDGQATRLPQLDLAFPRGGTVEDQRTTAGLDAARALRARHRAVWAGSIRPRGPPSKRHGATSIRHASLTRPRRLRARAAFLECFHHRAQGQGSRCARAQLQRPQRFGAAH